MIPQLGDQFNYKEGVIAGDECILISPINSVGTKWDDSNKHYRSLIIRKSDGKVVSRGFSRFCNWGETPAFEPWNPEWEFEVRAKIDGSLILASYHKDELILRTRNTFDCRIHETGEEFAGLLEEYSDVFDNAFINSEEYTILLEHTTPNRIIVIRESNEPELILLGIIENATGLLVSQSTCDRLATGWGIKRPKKYHYSSVQECLDDVKLWQDREGVVLYHEPTQTLKKAKADFYLARHRLKSHISSISNLVDFYMTTSKDADYNAFFKVVEESLDFELATQAAKDIQKVVDSHQQIKLDCFGVEGYTSIVKELARKEAAQKIMARYNDWCKSYAFMSLDNKPMPDKMLADLILEKCKN